MTKKEKKTEKIVTELKSRYIWLEQTDQYALDTDNAQRPSSLLQYFVRNFKLRLALKSFVRQESDKKTAVNIKV